MAVSVALVVLCAGIARAEDVIWTTWSVEDGGNGHEYAVLMTRDYWTNQKTKAEALGGYLASITSAEEQAHVHGLVQAAGGGGYYAYYCIGLFQDPTGAEPGQGWGWVSGEPLGYTNWGAGEPNDQFGSEDYGYITTSSGGWNDGKDGGATSNRGAVVEREVPPSDTTAPEVALDAPDPAELAWSSAPASVTISGSVVDADGRVASAALTIADEYGDAHDAVDLMALLGADGAFTTAVELSAVVDAADTDGRLYTVTLNAADAAGNVAEPVSLAVRVLPDGVPPKVELSSAEPASLPWERPNELKSVAISGTATDEGSGLASVMLSVSDEYGEFDGRRDITLDLDEEGSFSISLSLSSVIAGGDTDGRQYLIEVVATDLAGNLSAPASVTVRAARPNMNKPDKPGKPENPGNGHRPDPPPGRR
ncbi:MAG TPA: hypothetical protein DEP45_06410 [Armatimonadetes bacterium]|nr:hypothetical protein [Armatimonadota bacterium]